MRKVLILFIIFVLTFFAIIAIYHWEFFTTGRILPPNITLENCDEAIAEIKKYDWDITIATAVMKAESKCDQNAKGDTDMVFKEKDREYGYSVGLFQIRILPGREACDTFDIKKNISCAYKLYKDNNDSWSDWSMYENGKYKDYMWRTLW